MHLRVSEPIGEGARARLAARLRADVVGHRIRRDIVAVAVTTQECSIQATFVASALAMREWTDERITGAVIDAYVHVSEGRD